MLDLLRRRAVKQPRLPPNGIDHLITQADRLAHAGTLWQIATGIKRRIPRRKEAQETSLRQEKKQ